MRPACRARSAASSAGDGTPLTTVETNLRGGSLRVGEDVEHVAALDDASGVHHRDLVRDGRITSISWVITMIVMPNSR